MATNLTIDDVRKRLQTHEDLCSELELQMGQPEVMSDARQAKQVGQRYREQSELRDLYRANIHLREQIDDASELLRDKSDAEMAVLAASELRELEKQLEDNQERINVALLPKDDSEEADAVVEIRAGAGGDEAGIFAADLRRMYMRYAEGKRWGLEELHSVEGGPDILKETVFQVSGKGVYQRLRMESGVHRVQRVPVTESQGRIHTSTATVAVLPKAEEADIELDENDIKVDIFHAGGHGGQNVNKVATAVRLTHLPTQTVVVCQKERSQLQNRLMAMDILRSRIWDLEIQRKRRERDATRKAQIGDGDRSEKVRTYNFPQNRVSDHRINYTNHNLRETMDGDIDDLINALLQAERNLQLAARA